MTYHEIFFISEKYIIFRVFNEKNERFTIRNIGSNVECPIKKEDVLKIVYPWRKK